MSDNQAANNTPLERAAQEAAAGRLWRAKEILMGNISSHGYSPERFAACGRVLARMQDTKEAGKYLFLSGLADADEAPVVEVFLESIRGRPRQWVYSQFPSAARRIEWAAFPERVREDLQQMGFPANFKWARPLRVSGVTSFWDTIKISTVALLFFGLLIIGLLHGCYVVGGWVFQK
jgi:hypothetical protein